MANTFKFGNGNWAVKDGYALAYNDENNNFKPLPFDFTRASSATRVNKQGLIETVGSGKPRIDFTDNTSGHLLLEPSRTNSLPYSNDFTNAAWTSVSSGTGSAATVTANYAISPDGSQNASRLQISKGSGTSSSDFSTFEDSFSTISTASLSIWMKSNDSNTYSVALRSSNFVVCSVTPEWQRFELNNQSNIVLFQLILRGGYGTSDSADILIYGSQAENGSYATSYIPTQGSGVTRVAERNSQGNLSNVLSSSGVLYTEIELGESTTNTSSSNLRFSLSNNGSTNDWVFFGIENGDNLRTYVRASSSTTTDSTVDGVFPSAGTYKIAFRFDSNNTKVFVNGVQKSSDTSSTPPSNLNFFQQGGTAAGASDIAETLKVIETRLYDTALTDTELQNLTS